MSSVHLTLPFKNAETSAIAHAVIFQCQTIVRALVLRGAIAQMVQWKMTGEYVYQ